MSGSNATLLINRSDVRALLDMDACIAAVEDAFRASAAGNVLPAGALGTHAPGGGFHVKAAGLIGKRAYYAAKINANFPDNPSRRGLPTIQGVISLHDAEDGRLLALLDSTEITSLRTAAATAVAAKHLARPAAGTVTIIGCGVQARSQLCALASVRRLRRVFAYDLDAGTAMRYVREMAPLIECEVERVDDYRIAVGLSDLVITCTPSRAPLLSWCDIPAGAFIAAVGADSETKQELDPSILAQSTVVVDVLEQCATIGELHHALEAGVMRREDVHAELADVVSGRRPARTRDDEVTVFDSTGTALEDVAAASLVYERAVAAGHARHMRVDE